MARLQGIKSPYPYFGGKATVAAEVWQRFGAVKNYVEPFFGSGAVLLNRPQPFHGTETVNDKDGYINAHSLTIRLDRVHNPVPRRERNRRARAEVQRKIIGPHRPNFWLQADGFTGLPLPQPEDLRRSVAEFQ